MQVNITPLKEFSDLYQYFAITKADNLSLANEFIDYMLSNSVQETLYKIAMQSQFVQVENQNSTLSDMQREKFTLSLSPFYSALELKELQSISLLGIKGDINSQNKIKKMLLNLEK
jgi:ABC-type Fe3+ transport system substrate-binding protein